MIGVEYNIFLNIYFLYLKTLTLEWAWTSKNNLTEVLLPLGYYVFEETVFDLLFAKNESKTDVKKTV